MQKPLTWFAEQGILKGYSAQSTMQSVQISPNVRYIALDDADGDFGVFVVHSGDQVFRTYEVSSREEFATTYDKLTQVYEQV